MSTTPISEPPHGVGLDDYARIEAKIAEGDRPLGEVLREHELTEAAWTEVSIHWGTQMGRDAMDHRAEARLALVYSRAFSETQDELKPLVAMETEAYAELIAEIQWMGGPATPLARRRMSHADFLRLSRHYASKLASRPDEAARYARALEAAGKRPPPSP